MEKINNIATFTIIIDFIINFKGSIPGSLYKAESTGVAHWAEILFFNHSSYRVVFYLPRNRDVILLPCPYLCI